MPNKKNTPTKNTWWWVAATLLAIVLAGAAVTFLPLQEWVDEIESRISGLGFAGKLLFLLVFVIVTVLPVPAWMFSVAAGAVFGFVWGVVLVWSGALAGATLALLLTRYLFRDAVKALLARNPLFVAVDKALRKEGWRVVALLRLSPIPFGLKNYLFGVSKVKLRDFVLGTAVGKLPGTLVYVGLGATGRAVLDLEAGYKWALVAAGIIASVIATHLIARAAGKRLGFA